jgi:hypothetical protein
VYDSDFLCLLPNEVAQRAYCINEKDYARAVVPIRDVIFGPSVGCGSIKTNQPHVRRGQAVALVPNRGTTFIELDQPLNVVLFGVHMVSWN